MKKTKIDWADSTWNPVTGCLHGCEYCYARRIAERFGGASETHNNEACHECQWLTEGTGVIHDLEEPIYDYDNCRNAPYPFEFDPTFHRYKLDEPARWKKPRTIFVCSMADLFGEWVPDEWIGQVFDACVDAPQHRYLFLTKNPKRYLEYENTHPLMTPDRENFWYGTTITSEKDTDRIYDLLNWQTYNGANTFVSIEPILDRLWMNSRERISLAKWVIIGAETGNRKNIVKPQKEWIDHIAYMCKEQGTPVFMKESLREIMGDDFKQEFPWEV